MIAAKTDNRFTRDLMFDLLLFFIVESNSPWGLMSCSLASTPVSDEGYLKSAGISEFLPGLCGFYCQAVK